MNIFFRENVRVVDIFNIFKKDVDINFFEINLCVVDIDLLFDDYI